MPKLGDSNGETRMLINYKGLCVVYKIIYCITYTVKLVQYSLYKMILFNTLALSFGKMLTFNEILLALLSILPTNGIKKLLIPKDYLKQTINTKNH